MTSPIVKFIYFYYLIGNGDKMRKVRAKTKEYISNMEFCLLSRDHVAMLEMDGVDENGYYNLIVTAIDPVATIERYNKIASSNIIIVEEEVEE